MHVVHISETLPLKYKTALKEAERKFDFLRIEEVDRFVAPSSPSKKMIRTIVNERNPDQGIFGIYRLDDDDVLPVDFFSRMAPYIDPEHVGWRVSFPNSMSAVRGRSTYHRPWFKYFPKAAAGLLSIHQLTSEANILGLQTKAPKKGHLNLDTLFPTVLDARGPGFFQARHESQDSTLTSVPEPFFTRTFEAGAKRPAADLDQLKQYYPHVFARLANSPQNDGELLADGSHHIAQDKPLILCPTPFRAGILSFDLSIVGPYQIDIEIAGVPHASVSDLQDFMAKAGFEPSSGNRFVRTVDPQATVSREEPVLETCPGMTISSIRITTQQDPGSIHSVRLLNLA